MSSLFDRKGRNETDGRRKGVAKKSASVLAAVAVAGGPAVAAMPQAEARGMAEPLVYFEKIDEDGNPLGGSEWEFEFIDPFRSAMKETLPGFGYSDEEVSAALGKFRLVDNWTRETNGKDGLPDVEVGEELFGGSFTTSDGQAVIEDLDPRPGHFAFVFPDPEMYQTTYGRWTVRLSESKPPEGYGYCGSERPYIEYKDTGTLYDSSGVEGDKTYKLRADGFIEYLDTSGELRDLTDKRISPGVHFVSDLYPLELIEWEDPEKSIFTGPDGNRNGFVRPVTEYSEPDRPTYSYSDGTQADMSRGARYIHALKAVVNCKTPEPTTTETTTTPQPETTEPLPSTTTPSATTVAEVKPDAPAAVEQPTPSAPVADTPVATGSLSGTVVWDEGRSKRVEDGYERIPGLAVVALKDGKEVARTTTDENGFYKFDGLEPGEYTIAVYGPDGGRLFFDNKSATVVAGEEDTGNDWGFVRDEDSAAPAPAEEGEAAAAVAGEEDADNDSVSARDDSAAAPAPVEESDEEKATPVETVRMALATTGANSSTLAVLGAVLAALVALAVVGRRKVAHQ